ncbi:GNAT family N-acetyltransferase [Nocardiopsis gilva]|uniref:GNAT family N-acetyltransferase n=1 Tax=Nocardiopsis gilva TaxID=280236 RepID=UPI0019D32C15|nr:GNAT family N-acetyltransferase [Nocardiopsis gilva]
MLPGRMSGLVQSKIDGDGVLLRPWQAADRAAVRAGYADPDIQRWHCVSMTDDEAREWIDSWSDRWCKETGAGWAVVDVAGMGEVVGQISLCRLNLHEGLAEVSYWVLPAARGRGVASRALSSVTSWSFAELGLHRIEVCHSTMNPVSYGVARRAGFTAEGTKRGEIRHADGWHDMHIHARLDTDE